MTSTCVADGALQHPQHQAAASQLLQPWTNSDGLIKGLPAEALEHVRMFLRWRLAQALPGDELVPYARHLVEVMRKLWQNAHLVRKVLFLDNWMGCCCQSVVASGHSSSATCLSSKVCCASFNPSSTIVVALLFPAACRPCCMSVGPIVFCMSIMASASNITCRDCSAFFDLARGMHAKAA